MLLFLIGVISAQFFQLQMSSLRAAPGQFVMTGGAAARPAVESFASPPWLAVRPAMSDRIDELVFGLDGTLSAEHGVGLLLRDRVGPQKPDLEWQLMRAVKAALDPADLFNPGKMIPAG